MFLLKLGVLSSKRINLGVHQGDIDPRVADQVGMLQVDVLKIAANKDFHPCSFCQLREGGGCTKSDDFSEKFQTAFDPPPLIFGKLCCKF